jgi:hypothetical protein
MSDQAARFAKDRKPAGSVQPHRAASAAGRTGDRRVTGGAPAPGPVAERGHRTRRLARAMVSWLTAFEPWAVACAGSPYRLYARIFLDAPVPVRGVGECEPSRCDPRCAQEELGERGRYPRGPDCAPVQAPVHLCDGSMIARRRHLRYALRYGTWRHVARRIRWMYATAADVAARPPTWPVPDEAKARLQIHWPSTIARDRPSLSDCANLLRSGISAHLTVRNSEIPQPPGGVILFHVLDGRSVKRVVIDTDDRLPLHEVSEDVDLYFKMQYCREGYGDSHIRPGGYVSLQPALYRYCAQWRDLRRAAPPRFDVYGRFGTKMAEQRVRRAAISALEHQDRFRFQGGDAAVWWGEYMEEICRARVCVDLPGRGEFCYRLVEYLAAGSCIVGPELETEMPVPLVSGVHLQRLPRTLEGFVAACEELLHDPSRREAMSRAAMEYFDRYLALDQLGAYYVHTVWGELT